MPVIHKHSVGVAAVIYNPNGDVLLQERLSDHGNGLWTLCGGRLDNEKPVDGLLRELKEELGLEVPASSVAAIDHASGERPDGENFIMLFYALPLPWSQTHSVLNIEPHKCKSLKWHSPQKLPTNMWVTDVAAIERAEVHRHLAILRGLRA